MSAVTLRGLDPDLLAALRERARAQDLSVDSLISGILAREVEQGSRRERMRAQRLRVDAFRRRVMQRHGPGTPAVQLLRGDLRR